MRLMLKLIVLLALLQIPGLQAQETENSAFSTNPRVEQRLQETRSELAALPPGSSQKERELLLELEAALLVHREAIDYHEALVQELAEEKRSRDELRDSSRPAPYSFRYLDGLRETYQALQSARQATESQIQIMGRAHENASMQLTRHQQALRRYIEEAETGDTQEARDNAESAVRREELRAQILAESLARFALRLQGQELQLAAEEASLELLESKIGETRGEVSFTEEELAVLLRQIEAQRSSVLQQSSANKGASGQVTQVTWKLEILGIQQTYLEAAYQAFSNPKASARKAALVALQELKTSLDDWVAALALVQVEASITGKQMTLTEIDPADVEKVKRLRNRVGFAIGYLEGEGVSGKSPLDYVTGTLLAIWNTELYLAEESSVIGGQKVINHHAVTLGKLLRLVVILVVGWMILRFIADAVKRLLSRRHEVSQATAETARNWVFGLGVALLVIFGLNRVHIPFTAFAFLGGTLAIGIGFGAQTILKNFISGLILKLERPFKIGDLVEVDQVHGRITKIGLRASGIRHFSGVDTLVPNSQLLEERVTNWTYGDTPMRGELTVGVEYGSSLRETTHALLRVAEEHGQVLDKPESEARLLDFGDNALVFQLVYWFNAMDGPVERLPSDLRFMIARALNEVGVEIAFPQRDIHFDDNKPLRVELSEAEKKPPPDFTDS